MWIWYLLLGSGSGSRTVGKFHASSVPVLMLTGLTGSSVVVVGREVVVVEGRRGEFCKKNSVGVFALCFVIYLRTEIGRRRWLNTTTI